MDTKHFAIKIPKNEKVAMDYISNTTNNTLSKLFYTPIKDALYTELGLILLYKIDLRNNTNVSEICDELINLKTLSGKTFPIIEDFIGIMLDKQYKKTFWNIFSDIQLNEKEFLLHELDLKEVTYYLGKEYISNHGNFEEIDLNMARRIFFNYMLMTYFNVTALGSLNKLNDEWSSHQSLIKQFQNQIMLKYMNKFQSKKLEAIKVDEFVEVSEYFE